MWSVHRLLKQNLTFTIVFMTINSQFNLITIDFYRGRQLTKVLDLYYTFKISIKKNQNIPFKTKELETCKNVAEKLWVFNHIRREMYSVLTERTLKIKRKQIYKCLRTFGLYL